jgi:hypothetical protein
MHGIAQALDHGDQFRDFTRGAGSGFSWHGEA